MKLRHILILFCSGLLILLFQNCAKLDSSGAGISTSTLGSEEKNNELELSTGSQNTAPAAPASITETLTIQTSKTESPVQAEKIPKILSLKLIASENPKKFITLANDQMVNYDDFAGSTVFIEIITNEHTLSTRIQTNSLSDIDSTPPFTSADNFRFKPNTKFEIEAYPFSELSRKGIKGQAYKLTFSTTSSTEENLTTTKKGNWDVTTSPPKLINPLAIVLSDKSETSPMPDINGLGCEGLRYYIKLPADRDAKITMDKSSGPLKYPLWVTGGRNVHISGLDLKPVVQKGCDVGEANNFPKTPIPSKGIVDGRKFKNIHPRLPGGIAIRLQQSEISFVEGVDIDINGMEADCFVIRNQVSSEDIKNQYKDSNGVTRNSKATIEKFLQKRHVKVVNSRCTGVESLDNDYKKIGDGIHGDFLQVQGTDNIGTLTLENIVYLMSGNGISIQRWNGVSLKNLTMRNYYHSWDKRFATDDAYDRGGGIIFSLSADKYKFENVWTNEYIKKLDYGILNFERVGPRGGGKKEMPGMLAGTPPYDFAPQNKIGRSYSSPF